MVTGVSSGDTGIVWPGACDVFQRLGGENISFLNTGERDDDK